MLFKIEEHEINLSIGLNKHVECDINRIGQLYSNLVGNRMKHGVAEKPIFTEVKSEEGVFLIHLTDSDYRIPEKKMLNLFRPSFSTNSSKNKSGLGLRLYICSEIAKAHIEKIEVTSTDKIISFWFSVPIKKLNLE